MEEDGAELLNVRDTAKRLGVHENTVRNWVRQGVLQDARVPGSRFHRFRVTDVERLLTQRGASVPSLQTERRSLRPELVGASQLNQWPATRAKDAQATFPDLIRRLLCETPGASIVSLRAGDGVALAGLDGVADLEEATAFLPAGRLHFEFGVDAKPSTKAQSDYDKRVTEAPSGCSFVFATPRRWPGAAKWADERRAEGHFTDVRVIDADSLEGWLEQAPSTHHWISEHLGLQPRDAESLESWWHGLRSSTDPILPALLFLAGRGAEAEALQTYLLETEPRLTGIQCEWATDGLAFVNAVVTESSSEAFPEIPTPLIVRSAEVWDRVIQRDGRAILIPQFEGADVDGALNAGHHVISVLDSALARRRSVDITLPRLGRTAAETALQEAGLAWPEASRLAGLARRSLPAFVRKQSRNPQTRRPIWAEPPLAATLAPLVLVGSWKDRPGDRAFLSDLSGKAWNELEPLLVQAATGADPLFRSVGDHWTTSSAEESYLVLGEALTASTKERWKELVPTVLLEPDPLSGLNDHERIAAQMRGVAREYSETLRHGLAQGLAMAGAIADTPYPSVVGPTDAEGLVRQLLRKAQDDASGERWLQLVDVLPLLAEAAPDEFLSALEDDLSKDQPTIGSLFAERPSSFSIGPTTRQPALLWAIERLSWSPDYIVRAAQALARLCRFELPTNAANRPIRSLATVLCGWHNNTSASHDLRLEALDAVSRVSSNTGWKVLLALLPERHATSFPPARPEFRLDAPSGAAGVPISEWLRFVHALVARAVEWSTSNPDRVVDLVEHLDTVPSIDRDTLLAHIEDEASGFNRDARLAVFDKLHHLATSHERFADADWALPPEALEKVRTLRDQLESTDDARRMAYLFDWRPTLAGIDPLDHAVYDAALESRRTELLDLVLSDPEPTPILRELALRAKASSHLGWALAATDLSLDTAVDWLTSKEPQLINVARSWLDQAIRLTGGQALAGLLSNADVSADTLELVVTCIPPTAEAWQVLADWPETEKLYWATARIDVVDRSLARPAIDKLMAHGRPWTAIAVAAYRLEDPETDVPDEGVPARVVSEILGAAPNTLPGKGDIDQMTGYYVGKLLDFLQRCGATESELVGLEFAYFRLLDHSREPRALNRVLANDPAFFADLVTLVYRGKNKSSMANADADGRATQAMWVLRSWKGFPGRRDDGTLDAEVLSEWIRTARLLLSDRDRADIGDEVIGEAFAYSPIGADGMWPAEPVRDVIETIGSRELENGLVIGRLNARGITSRGAYEGGAREHMTAAEYRDWSKRVQATAPRTARALRAIAESYERDAERHDQQAQIDQDRG